MTKHKAYIGHIIKNLPHKPGVYRFIDDKGTVIYVGKAMDLKKRVSSYFKKSKNQPVKTGKMVSQVKDIVYTVVGSDLEAIMLETNLIKELQPKYNILMKDDKNFVYIKITVDEDFPRILITRKVEKDKARYYGPKTAQHKVEKTLKVLKKIFPFRHCQLDIEYEGPPKNPAIKRHRVIIKKAPIKYPCIDYHIKRCVAPCIGLVSPEEYRQVIKQVIDFLEGRHDQILKKLKEQMAKAAAGKKFESAAAIRDKIVAIEDIMEKQRISAPDHRDIDIINYVTREDKAFFNLFQVRSGKLLNQENFTLEMKNGNETPDEKEILTTFIQQYYEKATDLPKDILIPHDVENRDAVTRWISDIKGNKVNVLIPKRGRNGQLLKLSLQNAKNYSNLSEVKWQGQIKNKREKALNEAAELLKLEKSPKRIECYDISHIGGKETVASMVVFQNGFPKKEDYRKFKLHQETAGSPDDYASMEEVLNRRLKYLKPGMISKSIKILKPSKKDLEGIKKKLKFKKLPPGIFYKISFDKEKTGFIQLSMDKNKKVLIKNIQIKNTSNLRQIIKKTAEKMKVKRIYLSTKKAGQLTFEEAGFSPIRKIPDTFKIPEENSVLVFELSKQRIDPSFKNKPDLIVVDGGKGQLGVAEKVLKKYKLGIPLLSIAKKREEIFIPGRSKPAIYEKNHPFLHLIQHLRDESHRFAVSYQQNHKLKTEKHSKLDEIYGVGDSTKIKLLKHFGSAENIKNATLYELEKLVGKKNAYKIKEKLG